MSLHLRDKALWLVLGIASIFTIKGIISELKQITELVEIGKVQNKRQIMCEGTEEALRQETLEKLSNSPNFDLRAAALRIISERSSTGLTHDMLLEDLSSANHLRRRKAANALLFLVSSRTPISSAVFLRLRSIATFTALVDCLCNCLDEHETGTTDIVSSDTKPQCEKIALAVLNTILGDCVDTALDAGIVSKWLTKYPFPCTLHDRQQNMTFMRRWLADNNMMKSIIATISSSPRGLEQLQEYGLTSTGDEDIESISKDSLEYIGMNDEAEIYPDQQQFEGADAYENDDSISWPGQRQTNVRDHLRRRRREAMVLGDSDRSQQYGSGSNALEIEYPSLDSF